MSKEEKLETESSLKAEAVAPEGWESTVKKLKKHKDKVDNPWALAWWMKGEGYKPKKARQVNAAASAGTILHCALNSASSSTPPADGSSKATISRPPRSSSGSAGSPTGSSAGS